MRVRRKPAADDLPPLGRLSRAAEEALATSLAIDFETDPILGPEVSPLVSRASSLQKRHGFLLEFAIVCALRHSGRFVVLPGTEIPITAAADSLASLSSADALAGIELPHEPPFVRNVTLDLVVVDRERGWAGGFECKRGRGKCTSRLLRPIVRDLEATGVLLTSYLQGRGFETVGSTVTGLIDIYGGSRAPDHLVLNLADLDAFFGVPVSPVIDEMNASLARGFRRAIPSLLAPLRFALADGAPGPSPFVPTVVRSRPPRVRLPVRESGPTAPAR